MAHSLLATTKRPSATRLLTFLLDAPDLVSQIPDLPPAVLAKVIEHVGLEDAGEIVALATTEQLVEVFDHDLWRSDAPGEDETFDADRFPSWLEVMLEAGDGFVADRLTELSPDLVTLAFHEHVLVLDIDVLFETMRASDEGDAEATEKALASCLSEELDGYQLIARRHEGWDSVLAALLALDRDHHDESTRLLERLCRLSGDAVERHGGLHECLSPERSLEDDVAAERDERRAAAGHVVPSSAAAFLKLARAPASSRDTPTVRDPLTAAYFRTTSAKIAHARPARTRPVGSAGEPAARDLAAWLREAGVLSDIAGGAGTRALLGANERGAGRGDPLVVVALRELASSAPSVFAARSDELAYLANVLVAACSHRGRRMRPIEAVRAAVATTSLGLALAGGEPHLALRDRSADVLFRSAWRHLHREVVLPAGEAAASLLASCAPSAAKRMKNDLASGTPWRGRPELDVLLEHFDADVVAGLEALMDECPTLSRGVSVDEAPRWLESLDDVEAARARLAKAIESARR
jgi:hypothetical protein